MNEQVVYNELRPSARFHKILFLCVGFRDKTDETVGFRDKTV